MNWGPVGGGCPPPTLCPMHSGKSSRAKMKMYLQRWKTGSPTCPGQDHGWLGAGKKIAEQWGTHPSQSICIMGSLELPIQRTARVWTAAWNPCKLAKRCRLHTLDGVGFKPTILEERGTGITHWTIVPPKNRLSLMLNSSLHLRCA